MIKIILLFLSVTLFGWSVSQMKLSSYDKRIGIVNYNPNDVMDIYAKEGYFTMIEFGENETVLDGSTGFNEGWTVKTSGNTAYIMAKPYMSSVAEVEGEKGLVSNKSVITPNSKDWATNIFIRTNRRIYIGDLHLSEDGANYKIKIKYSSEAQKARKVKNKQAQKKRNAKKIAKELDRVKVPKNWDYLKKVNKGSDDIAPNYVYDDGTFTYFGFDRTKKMPAIFRREGDQEFSINSHTKKTGKYYVKVVHSTGGLFFLRSGKKLVGVLNGGKGKNPDYRYLNTSNQKVRREIIK